MGVSSSIFYKEAERTVALTKEENCELIIAMKNGDERAKMKLFHDNLRLLRSIASSFVKKYSIRDADDLEQEAAIALFNAIDKYNPDEGAFSTYITKILIRRMIRFVSNGKGHFHIPYNKQELLHQYHKLIKKSMRDGKELTDEEICRELKINQSKLDTIREIAETKHLSLDMSLNDEDKGSLKDVIRVNEEEYDNLVDKYDNKLLLLAIKDILDPYGYFVIYHRILSDEAKTQRDIASLFGVLPQSISQKEQRCRKIIKSYLDDEKKYQMLLSKTREKYGMGLNANSKPLSLNDISAFLYIKNDLNFEEQCLYYICYVLREEHSDEHLANTLNVTVPELIDMRNYLNELIKEKFKDVKKFKRFKNNSIKTLGTKIFDEIPSIEKNINYKRLAEEYSKYTFDDILSIYQNEIEDLSFKERQLLEEYFKGEVKVKNTPFYIEKNVNLILFGFKRKTNKINANLLYKTFLDNLDEFDEEQRLYLECFYFKNKPIKLFNEQYPNSFYPNKNAYSKILYRLEKIYFGIDKLFDKNITKEKYITVRNAHGDKVSSKQIEYLDLYFGINETPKPILEISEIKGEDYEKVHGIVLKGLNHIASIYTNNSVYKELDKERYIPYIDDVKMHFTEETKNILKLFMIENKNYEEITELINKGKDAKNKKTKDKVSKIIYDAIERIDYYRFGIYETKEISVTDIDTLCDNLNYPEFKRDVLKLYYVKFNSLEEIAKVYNKTTREISRITSSFYEIYLRYASREVVLDIDDYISEINKPTTDSILNDSYKKIASLFYGIKSSFNKDGIKLSTVEIATMLGEEEKTIKRKIELITQKVKCSKINLIKPDLGYIPCSKLKEILDDPHLPITDTDREIICYLYGLNGYSYKTEKEIAEIYNLTKRQIVVKYRRAIVKIRKYLNNEIEGAIDYKTDVLSNLRYYPKFDRKYVLDFYKDHLTLEDIAKKYGIKVHVVQNTLSRIKNYTYNLINEPDTKRFDFDYYEKAIKDSRLPFYGNLDLATKIFDLYFGEENCNFQEIKEKLNIEASPKVICKMLDMLMISCCKLKMGIYKTKEYSYDEIKEYYDKNKDSFCPSKLKTYKHYFKKYNNTKRLIYNKPLVPEEISTDLLRKDSRYVRFAAFSQENVRLFLKKYRDEISEGLKRDLMAMFDISPKDFMSGKELNHVYKILERLEKTKNIDTEKKSGVYKKELKVEMHPLG